MNFSEPAILQEIAKTFVTLVSMGHVSETDTVASLTIRMTPINGEMVSESAIVELYDEVGLHEIEVRLAPQWGEADPGKHPESIGLVTAPGDRRETSTGIDWEPISEFSFVDPFRSVSL